MPMPMAYKATTSVPQQPLMDTLDLFSAPSSGTHSARDSTSTGSHSSVALSTSSSPSSVMANDFFQSDSRCSKCASSEYSDVSDEELDFLELSDEPPSPQKLAEAGNIHVYDEHGNARPFHSLYHGAQHQGQRQLIIFVRHFWCGACRAYLKALTETITPSVYFSLPVPTTITIIACGEPTMIPQYQRDTRCPFRIYAEPTQRLYKMFGMRSTMNFGRKKNQEYVEDSIAKMVLDVAAKIVVTGAKEGYYGAREAGPIWQVGGEFLFEDGEPVWCHRMRNIRGHASMEVLMKVLGMHMADMEESPYTLRKSSIVHMPESPKQHRPVSPKVFSSPKLFSSPRLLSSPKLPSSPPHPPRTPRPAEPEKAPKGLQMIVIDDTGEVPKARLKRRSVTLSG